MTHVVFDIGNVLIRWDPLHAFADAFGGAEAAGACLARMGFAGLNARADRGALFSELAAEIADEEDRALFASYPERFHLTIAERVPGSWEILARLKAAGVPLHAITNWSEETWPAALALYPALAESFGTIVVSGTERMMKPERAIFDLLCARAGVAPGDCLFIDDSPKNVDGARAAGMEALLFTDAPALERDLTERGLI
ncbi:HAD family hydrolase [Celeribacter indicus]|uniref:HAD family hydrolase n=1 Tax=Celeribacter indicus TaxID=1208324 RepID=A0A0B5DXQ2_9RHOB|nr:HAD family phosphatase [Celeribacter indicus]AJE45526.1 HAD family hydrolase [Celeribacter indicus]SDW86773.1 2-haloacid dehalogenase [Celeribacter indicus]